MKKIPMYLFIFTLCIVSFTLITHPSFAQNPNINRPKIGLVLGGGGARGAAHGGVIKVLEENRIPIDYIAGTSMGAIVGALYASGYPPQDIYTIAGDEIDWREMFIDTPSEKYIPFHNKGDMTRLSRIKIGVQNGKMSLPQGVVEGRNLNFALRRLYLHVSDIKDFDDLHIPFRCVSTNIVDGSEVVFDRGDLAHAVRASMAVPGALAPIRDGDRLLVDGMVVKNVPVDIVQKMGADVIIVVDVGVPLLEHKELESFLDIMNQMFSLLFKVNVQAQLDLLDKNTDILILPDLGKNSSGDFSKVMENMRIGEVAARKYVDSLKRYSVSEAEYEKFLKKQRRTERELPDITSIRSESKCGIPKQRISDVVDQRSLIGPLNYDTIHKQLEKIYGLGLVQTADFRVEKKNGTKELVFDATERAWDKNYFRFGLNMQDDFDNNAAYELLLDYTMTDLNRLGAEWESVVGVGTVQGFATEFYQPLDYGDTFFIAPHFRAVRRKIGTYGPSGELSNTYRTIRTIGQIDMGINYETYAQLRVGINKGVFDRRPFFSSIATAAHTIDKAAFVGRIEYNTIDNFNFPKHGLRALTRLSVENEIIGADENYNKLEFLVSKPFTYKKHTLLCSFGGGTFIGNDPTYDGFITGGLFNLSGYNQDQLGGYHKGIGRLIYYYNVKEFPFTAGLHIGGSFEYGNVFYKRSDIDFDEGLLAGSVFIGLDTLFGPLYFGYGIAEEKTDDGEFYFVLGRPF